MGYVMDVTEDRRRLVNELDNAPDSDTPLTRGAGGRKEN